MRQNHPQPESSKTPTRRESIASLRAGGYLRVGFFLLSAWILGAFMITHAWAGEVMSGHACCCPTDDESDQPEAGHHCGAGHLTGAHEQTQNNHPVDCRGPFAPDDCHCSVEQQGEALAPGGALSLSSSTLSFATTTAHIPYPQVSIPLARAPDAPADQWLRAQHPPQPIYILNRTLRI